MRLSFQEITSFTTAIGDKPLSFKDPGPGMLSEVEHDKGWNLLFGAALPPAWQLRWRNHLCASPVGIFRSHCRYAGLKQLHPFHLNYIPFQIILPHAFVACVPKGRNWRRKSIRPVLWEQSLSGSG